MQNYAKKTWSARLFTMYAMTGFSDVAWTEYHDMMIGNTDFSPQISVLVPGPCFMKSFHATLLAQLSLLTACVCLFTSDAGLPNRRCVL